MAFKMNKPSIIKGTKTHKLAINKELDKNLPDGRSPSTAFQMHDGKKFEDPGFMDSHFPSGSPRSAAKMYGKSPAKMAHDKAPAKMAHGKTPMKGYKSDAQRKAVHASKAESAMKHDMGQAKEAAGESTRNMSSEMMLKYHTDEIDGHFHKKGSNVKVDVERGRAKRGKKKSAVTKKAPSMTTTRGMKPIKQIKQANRAMRAQERKEERAKRGGDLRPLIGAGRVKRLKEVVRRNKKLKK
jgi:hypothetical protein